MSLVTALDGPILGRYAPIDELGSGATSTVVLAEDLVADREVAVKLVIGDADLIDRARCEIAALSKLQHPNIASLQDFGWHEGSLAIVMEVAAGRPVSEIWAGRAPTGRAAVSVARQALGALAHAHARGIVHRDVKPANLLVDSRGAVTLIDFGVAQVRNRAGLTTIGDLIGTVAYMAPEQARGEAATAASDVWSASMIAYEGLTGVHPMLGRTPRETWRRVCHGRVAPLRHHRPGVPAALAEAVDHGLRRRPEDRPRAAELADQLALAVRQGRGGRRPGFLVASGGLAMIGLATGAPAVMALAGVGGALALWRRAPRRC